MKQLSDTTLRRAQPKEKPYKLNDGRGLFCEVRPTGAKIWRYRFYIRGRSSHYTIGEYPAVGLKLARQERERLKQLAMEGIDPNKHKEQAREEHQAAQRQTFETVAVEFAGMKATRWSDYYQKQWTRGMTKDIWPAIGAKPVRDVTPQDVLAILKAIEGRGSPSVAQNARMWISQVCQHAVATLRADFDPAAPLQRAIHRPPTRHNPGLAAENIAELCEKLDGFGGYRTTNIALWLLLYTFPRTVELREAAWAEFDLERGLWTVPAERMKMRRGHLVPLPDQAIDLLVELNQYTGGQRHLFPNNRRPQQCMSPTTINRALERLGYGGELSAHGFRTTASTLLHGLGARSDIIERQLAHIEKNRVKAAYNHAEYLPERTRLLQDWADYIDHMRGAVCLLREPFTDRDLRPAGSAAELDRSGKVTRLYPRVNPRPAKADKPRNLRER